MIVPDRLTGHFALCLLVADRFRRLIYRHNQETAQMMRLLLQLIAILIRVPSALVICLIGLLKILFIVLDGLKDGQSRSPVALE